MNMLDLNKEFEKIVMDLCFSPEEVNGFSSEALKDLSEEFRALKPDGPENRSELPDDQARMVLFFEKLIEYTKYRRTIWDSMFVKEEDTCSWVSGKYPYQPLFKEVGIYDPRIDFGYLKPTFYSEHFDVETCINDNCYELKDGRGGKLYLMSVCKEETTPGEETECAVELWSVSGSGRLRCMVGSKSNCDMGGMLNELYRAVERQFEEWDIAASFKVALNKVSSDSELPFDVSVGR